MNNLVRKGYARILVDKEENIEKVKQIIEEIDPYEFTYLPEDLLLAWDTKTNLETPTYTHKFCDMDMNILIKRCWALGIYIAVLDNMSEYECVYCKDETK